MIEDLVQKYGKQIINELIGMMIIKGNFDGVDLLPLLKKHKILRSNAKYAVPYCRHYNPTGRKSDGTWGYLNDIQHILDIRNGNSKVILTISFRNSDLPHIMEVLND